MNRRYPIEEPVTQEVESGFLRDFEHSFAFRSESHFNMVSHRDDLVFENIDGVKRLLRFENREEALHYFRLAERNL